MNAVPVRSEIVSDESIETITANAADNTVVPFMHRNTPDSGSSSGELLNSHSLLALYAVLAHVASSHDMPQELVQTLVEAEFSVDHVAKIPQRDFQGVMAFLLDLRMDEIRSRR